jgi:AraC-like DNA-binding protein
MKFKIVIPDKSISLLVKSIMLFEEDLNASKTVLPFFADGLPGLVYHITPDGQWAQPHNKKMPISYLYGQTIKPMELQMKGTFKMIAFQLYPFVLSSFFHLNPKEINNGCYDLTQLENWNKVIDKLNTSKATTLQIEVIQKFLYNEYLLKKDKLDFAIRAAIQLVFEHSAQITVQEICEKIHLTVRTFQRRFLAEVGISPKEFIQIIKFQQSLDQLSMKEHKKLTDIVYKNGFADHSHFIRVFKSFTGQTPKSFTSQ